MTSPAAERNKSFGFKAVGVFLFFGATMASYAALTLAFPGTVLDRAWALNPEAHQQLATMGRVLALPFLLLALLLFIAGWGWFHRRRWAWILAVCIVSVNLLGDAANAIRGEWLKGMVGVVIAGLLLAYMAKQELRAYFEG